MTHNSAPIPQPQQPRIWEVATQHPQSLVRQKWLALIDHEQLHLRPLTALKEHWDEVPDRVDDLIIQTTPRPSLEIWDGYALGGEQQSHMTSPIPQMYGSEPIDRTTDTSVSRYIHEQFRHHSHVSERTSLARLTLIPSLVALEVGAEVSFFMLHHNVYGDADGAVAALRGEPKTELARLAINGSLEHLAGTYRNINVGNGGEFTHPTAEILQGLSKRLFAIVDRVIHASGILPENLAAGGELAIIQAITNIEFLLKTLHPPTDGSGRTSEDFIELLWARIPGIQARHISTQPYRNNGGVLLRQVSQNIMRTEFALRAAEILGIPRILVRDGNLLSAIGRAYGIPYNNRRSRGSILTNAERQLALLDVGYFYELEELLNQLEDRPGEPILLSAAAAAKELEGFPREYDPLDNTKRAYVSYLMAVTDGLYRNNYENEAALRRALSLVSKITEHNDQTGHSNRTPFTEDLALDVLRTLSTKAEKYPVISMKVAELGVELLQEKAKTGDDYIDTFYERELLAYRAQVDYLRSHNSSL